MAHAPQPELIHTEAEAALDRFVTYLTSARVDRKRPLRANTARAYRLLVRQFIDWAQTANPSPAQAAEYVEALADRELSDSTRRSFFFAIKAWFEFKRRPLTDDEERAFLVPPTPRNAREAPLPLERIQELLGRIPDRRRYAIVRTLLATGIRRAELAALKVKHVDFQARRVWVPEIGEDGIAAAKGGHGGWVCISQVALDAIAEHLASRPLGGNPEAPLFESLNTQDHLTPDAVTGLVGDLTEAVLGERVTPHELRHAFASHAASGSGDRPPMSLTALQRQLRHKDKTTTLRYVHAVEDLNVAYERSAPQF